MGSQNKKRQARRPFVCFQWAFEGLVHAFKTERNVRIHFTAALVVMVGAFVLDFTYYEKLLLLVIIGIVIAAELVNTAIERIVDLVSPDEHPLAKNAKDVGAAAVLLVVCIAVIAGIAVFIHHYM